MTYDPDDNWNDAWDNDGDRDDDELEDTPMNEDHEDYWVNMICGSGD